jgi:hypothetical protein
MTLGCAGLTHSLLVGEWTCHGTTLDSVATVTVYNWGEITITRADGQGARATYTEEGNVMDAWDLWWGPRGAKTEFRLAGGVLTGPKGEVCARTT